MPLSHAFLEPVPHASFACVPENRQNRVAELSPSFCSFCLQFSVVRELSPSKSMSYRLLISLVADSCIAYCQVQRRINKLQRHLTQESPTYYVLFQTSFACRLNFLLYF